MQSRWSGADAAKLLAEHSGRAPEDLLTRIYSARLLGQEPSLVLHGGGNTSVKSSFPDIFGEHVPAIFVKASGFDMASIEVDGHPALDLDRLRRLRSLSALPDSAMVNEIRSCLFDGRAPTPSIETLVHALIPVIFIDHTHADAILALTNRRDGRQIVREALGEEVIVLDYVTPGFELAKAAALGYEASPKSKGMVWLKHGIVTWGATARESYEAMIELVSQAENYLARHARQSSAALHNTPLPTALERWSNVAPVLRGLLAAPTQDPDRPHRHVILEPLISQAALEFVDSPRAKELALSPPLTSDHLIRTKALPLWIDGPDYDHPERLRTQIADAVSAYIADYEEYFRRNALRLPEGVAPFESGPRVVLMPGLGAIACGRNVESTRIARDITSHTIEVKAAIAASGGVYEGLPETALFDMEYRTLQHAKLPQSAEPPLEGHVAVVTGAAGAIGAAICEALLDRGCHVAATDLAAAPLDELVAELQSAHGETIIGAELDVTEPDSVRRGFEQAVRTWGGVDLVIVNAGAALVSALDEMSLESFRRLERINVEGCLLVLAEAARLFKLQGTGGDIVLISTKNVFAPGARFGAYSATKAAAHQLARVASLEMAELGVRVNMVAPDAVFSHGDRKSGLWAEVGPDRMKARGLTETQLEEYYRGRNLLRAKVTARHVAQAVLFFATRQTPTTGATLPVDGGLPDATPR
ncbi:MAG: bifunctional aldolase/short-chain dehydrogenase [Terriglobia bacterium]